MRGSTPRAWRPCAGLPRGVRPSTSGPHDLPWPLDPRPACCRAAGRRAKMRTSQPGPPGHANAAPWVRWLLPAAVAAGFVALLALPRGAAPGPALSYTRFVADVGAGTVRAVTIGPAGQVTGSLAGGQLFTTTIPVALGGNGLAGDLAAQNVQVTATAVMPSSLLSVLIGLL